MIIPYTVYAQVITLVVHDQHMWGYCNSAKTNKELTKYIWIYIMYHICIYRVTFSFSFPQVGLGINFK